jgi:hypothetical protein
MPERTSISRAIGFNKAKVNKFYELLQSTLFNSELEEYHQKMGTMLTKMGLLKSQKIV